MNRKRVVNIIGMSGQDDQNGWSTSIGLYKWGGRNKNRHHFQDINICLGGRIKPGIISINDLATTNSAAVIGGRNNLPHLL